MKHILEYLLGKNKKATISVDPNDIFARLCEGRRNMTKFNTHHVVDTMNEFLTIESIAPYLRCILQKINKAIDNGYVLDYKEKVSGHLTNINDEREEYNENTKMLHFFAYGKKLLETSFIDFKRLSVYTIEMYDNEEFELYTYIFKDFDEMKTLIGFGSLRDKKHSINTVEELEQTINKYLDL